MYPSDRKYTKDFLWLRIEGAAASIGITDHVVKHLNEVSVVVLPTVGRKLVRGEVFGTVEGLKSASDLQAPVAGLVAAINSELIAEPARVQTDPHGTWLIQLAPAERSKGAALFSSAEFEEYLRSITAPKRSNARSPQASDRSATGLQSPGRSAVARPVPVARVAAAPAPVGATIPPEKAINLLWSMRLRDCRLHGGNSAFGDSDYSGGSYFSWRERDIAFTNDRKAGGRFDRRYVWRDTTHTRVSVAGLSNSTTSHTDHAGTWDIEVVGRVAFLVMQDGDRGRLRYRIEDGPRGGVLLDGRPYTLQKRQRDAAERAW
jgi:glycine cleavage system H protein